MIRKLSDGMYKEETNIYIKVNTKEGTDGNPESRFYRKIKTPKMKFYEYIFHNAFSVAFSVIKIYKEVS